MEQYKTVAEARKAGVKVRVGHFRLPLVFGKVDDWKGLDEMVMLQGDIDFTFRGQSSKGGKTVVEISFEDKDSFGVSYCSPKDNYNRKIGVEIALKRAIEAWNS